VLQLEQLRRRESRSHALRLAEWMQQEVWKCKKWFDDETTQRQHAQLAIETTHDARHYIFISLVNNNFVAHQKHGNFSSAEESVHHSACIVPSFLKDSLLISHNNSNYLFFND